VSEQVWSSFIGYPSAGEYLEFHRKHPGSGLRYHRITDTKVELSQKQPYRPEDTFTRLYQHATHFANTVKAVLKQYHEETGRHGTVVAPFDAELFGHWWHEGPNFLRDVLFILSRDSEVQLLTTPEVLAQHPPDKVMRLPEGSWGQHGNHSVWINEKTRWMWEVEYRAEGRFLRLLYALPWREHEQVRQILERAGRELMLLQASDWPFVVHSKGAVDYGIERFGLHATRFDRALDVAESVAAGASPRLSPVQKVQLEEMDLHDTIFPTIDLNWWM
jgi:1,4-alpha-glucan branching enzyme